MNENGRLDYPYLISVFDVETDMVVEPIAPTAASIAGTILNYTNKSGVTFYSSDDELVLSAMDENHIEFFTDAGTFLENHLKPAIEKLMQTGSYYEAIEEADIPHEIYHAIQEKYYEPPCDVNLA